MTNNTREMISNLGPPQGAAKYVNRYFTKNNLNPTSASKILEVNQSTVKRFLDGGNLSVEMAAKLERHFGLKSESLFQAEAARLAHKAKEMLNVA